MRFLVDAQLPKRLAIWRGEAGFDACHTLDLPLANTTADREVMHIADDENRIVITKDADFVDSHLLRGKPRKLLLIATGNISNNALIDLISTNFSSISAALARHEFVELGKSQLIIHD